MYGTIEITYQDKSKRIIRPSKEFFAKDEQGKIGLKASVIAEDTGDPLYIFVYYNGNELYKRTYKYKAESAIGSGTRVNIPEWMQNKIEKTNK